MITESEFNELRAALTAANAKVAGLVRERDDLEVSFKERFKMWRSAAEEAQSERDARLAAEARNARMAEALQKAADRFSMLKVNCRDIPASLDGVLHDGAYEAQAALSAPDAQAGAETITETAAYRRGQLDAAQEIEQATAPTAELVSRFVTQTVKDALRGVRRAAFERAIKIVRKCAWKDTEDAIISIVSAIETELRK